MKNGMMAILSFVAAWFLLASHPAASVQMNDALTGVKSAKAVFDVRMGNPKSAAFQLKLMHQTYMDLMAARKKPVFRIVFLGPSVKLISKNREGFAPEDNSALDEIASEVSAMSKSGIHLECALLQQGHSTSILPPPCRKLSERRAAGFP